MLFALTCEDGHLMILRFAGPDRQIDPAEVQSEIDRGDFGGRKVVRWRPIAAEDLPTDRTDRDRWRDDGARISIATE